MLKRIFVAALLALVWQSARAADDLAAVVNAKGRSPQFVARDRYRHPLEELRFLGVRPNAAVAEIWPGGGYWSEILAPYLAAHGTYYTPVEAGEGWAKYSTTFRDKVAANPSVFGKVKLTELGVGHDDIAPPGSLDFVLDTRNFHNWMDIGDVPEMLAAIRRAMKPGAILVMEDHRARGDAAQDPKAGNGYVRQDFAIAAVTKAGFRFVASSEILANPNDTANWPKGVWTLPPTLALGAKDRAKYLAIGEADNFLLKFQKI